MRIYCAFFVGFSALLISGVGNAAQDIIVSFETCGFSETRSCRSGSKTDVSSASIQIRPSRSTRTIEVSPAAPHPKILDQLDIYYSNLIGDSLPPPFSGISLEQQRATPNIFNSSPTDFNTVGPMAWIPDSLLEVAWIIAIGISIVFFATASRTPKIRNDPTR